MSDKVEVNNRSMGLCSFLTIIFVIAKLTGYIHWSWWLVFSPVLVDIGLFFLVLIGVLVVGGIIVYFGGR